MSETRTPISGSKRRKVAAPTPSSLDKETLSVAAGKKRRISPRLEATKQEYLHALSRNQLSNLNENADLWDTDTVKSRKAAAKLNKAFTSQIDLTRLNKINCVEVSEMLMLNAAQIAGCAQSLQEKCSKDASLFAESHDKITKLTQELEEAHSEIKLVKLNREIAEKLVEQAKHEKHFVELKFTGEKAFLERKIKKLETELQQQKDRFKDALLDAEVDGYNKCVMKAKKLGLRYMKLLLDPVSDPIGNHQEESLVHPSAENSIDVDYVSDSTTTVPIGTDSTDNVPTVSSKEKSLVDPADPMFYNSIIEVLGKKNLEGQVGGVVSGKGDNDTPKPTLSSLNISEDYNQLKHCKTELTTMKIAAFSLGYNKCCENIGEGNVYVPSEHNLQSFVAWEHASLGHWKPSSGNTEHKW